jgi:hypothetical protein
LTQTERGNKSISFFNELEIRNQKIMLKMVSFFNELEIRKSCSSWFHFLMSLKSENHAQGPLFHFLTRFPQRRKNYPRNSLLDHGFQEDNALEGHHVKGKNLVMASKRSSLDRRNTCRVWQQG